MKKQIFIVDDDEAILDVIKIILDENGFRTTVISSANDLFKKLKTVIPDLIFLDIWLSGTDGIEISRKLKTSPKYKKIPVIMISANNQGEEIAKKSGSDGFLAKPFEIDDLIKKVKNLIND